MSNTLPVIWVPPVEPPDPNERPPRRRGNLGVILAAVAIVVLPLLAFAVVRETMPRTAEIPKPTATETAVVAPAAPVAEVPLPTARPAAARVAIGPAPETSGGNQPYIAASGASNASPSEAKAAAEASAEPRAALGPDGRPIRVIGIDRPSSDMAQGATADEIPRERVVEDAAGEPAAPAKAKPDPTPIVASEPPGRAGDPVAAPAVKAAAPVEVATPAPAAEAKRPPAVEAKPSTSPATVAPTSEPPIGLRTEPSAPATVAAPPSVAPSEPETAEAKPQKAPLPPKRETAKAPRSGGAETARSGEADAFADRLAAIRRSEEARMPAQPRTPTQPRATSRAQVDEPVYEDEDEVIVVTPRRRWGFAPPVFGGPVGPVLRPYETPSRASMDRAPQGENCHYHAWPTEDMAFHRDVRCHWHREPDDPSIRYVR